MIINTNIPKIIDQVQKVILFENNEQLIVDSWLNVGLVEIKNSKKDKSLKIDVCRFEFFLKALSLCFGL